MTVYWCWKCKRLDPTVGPLGGVCTRCMCLIHNIDYDEYVKN